MMETQQQQFMVGASDPDGQVLSTVWKLDGKTVSEGGAYTLKTDYSSAGQKTLVATVTDGSLSASHEWRITVLNLNRPPTAVINSPRDNVEVMQGTSMRFDGSSSSDPDNEKLAYTWKESGVLLSDQATFERAFSHGIHTVTLEVRDPDGATGRATVHFRVRWSELSLVMGLDRAQPAAGDRVTVVVTISNTGDTNAAEPKIAILVDGKALAGEDLPEIAAGGSHRTQFQWKAVKGAHTITAVIGDQSWNQPVTVSEGNTAASGAVANELLLMAVMVVLAVALAGWGIFALRKR
jgi:hypothetical protein